MSALLVNNARKARIKKMEIVQYDRAQARDGAREAPSQANPCRFQSKH